jgi:hypothetical protein
MATTAINVFKTYTASLTANTSTVSSTPPGYTSIVLLAQISNITNNTISVTSNFVRAGVPTSIVKNGLIPKNDAMNIISGKLILQTGDTMTANASVAGAAQMIISIIESVNP